MRESSTPLIRMPFHIALRRRLAPAALLVFSAAFVTFSQTPPQSKKEPAISARSEVVLVPVIVTDKSGAHISDLAQSAFTVLENGQPQQIAFFHHIHAGTSAPAPTPSLPPGEFTNSLQTRSDRSAILVFDLLNSSISEQSNARDELMKFLSGSPALDQPVCLLAFDENGVRLLRDFTKDPALLAESLRNTKGHRSSKDTPATNPLDSAYKGVHGWHTLSANRNDAAMKARQDLLQYATDNADAALAARTWLTLEALHQIGEAYSGVPGRKALIWATGGFPFEMGDSSHFATYDRDLLPAYDDAWRTLARANIAVYPLDVEDLTDPAYVAPNIGEPLPQHFSISSDVTKLESFAESTGGKLCDRQMTALGCFNAANDDSSDYYLLGFYQVSGNQNPGWRKLTVKVDRPGVRVRSRSGYYVRGPHDENASRKEDVLVALASPLDFTALRFTVRLTTIKEVNGKKSVGFEFLVPPGVVTVDESDNNHVSLDFAALAEKPDGTTAEGGYSQALEGHIKPEGIAALHSKGLSFPASIDLPPGQYSVRFVVRDNVAGQVGSTTGSVNVP